MHRSHKQSLVPAIALLFSVISFAQKGGHTLNVTVTEKGTRDAIIMATMQLQPIGALAVPDVNGKATINNIPSGEYTLQISYVGFEPVNTRVKISKDLQMQFQMTPSSLSLREVQVVARQRESGASTANVIGRQAIDHLQATSLADVMQLIPGQLMDRPDLTAKQGLQLRTLQNNSTMAFGTSIVVDGVPMSNNGEIGQGAFSGTAFAGSDMRQISADNIEEVEVIRGIPSAEYGDLTSGLVVVHSKVGVTPWQVKAKINPGLQNYSVGKGFSLDKAGIINASFDYAKAWGDPRQKTRSFDRYTANIGWGYDITPRWHADTKLRFMQAKDWTGQDPDAIQDGTENKSKTTTIGLNHNGRIRMDLPLMRSLKYTLGITMTQTDTRNTSFVSVSSGLLPILTARETGYYSVPWVTSSYLATGITESRPGNIFFKMTDDFFWRSGKTVQSFKVGVDYHYDWNTGRGYYNADESLPYRPNSNGRPRAFDDIPGLHQLSAFVEDQFTYNINKVNRLRINFGLRFTSMQPFSDVATTALSPRLNAAFTVTKWLDIRGGIGLNSKTPGMDYLYPDKKYTDRVAANYLPQDNPAGQLLVYHTNVYEVARTEGLKNATNYKTEVGIDIKLPGDRRMSILAYYDKTPTGFSAATEYTTYTANFYDLSAGLTPVSGAATIIDYGNPARIDTVFATTGKVGNFNVSVNKGIELDWDLGKIKPLQTSVYLTGAYMESKRWSKDMNSSNPTSYPASYSQANTVPFKVVYPSEMNTSTYRKFSTMLRLVTHIPALKMVASLSGQAIFYNYSHSEVPAMDPIGWIDTDLSYHEITPAMLADESYTIRGVSLQKQRRNGTENEPTKSPVTWLVSGRLTKELGRIGGFSFYANNLLYHEPWKSTSRSNTLTQQNAGSFSFGVELYFNL